ncbi:undecaprenyl pyrophosphate synthase [Desulfamplus magnetovallimortis]|uniref:Isoprenyl transferase n=1 Tax=Desulfamplus magnetovallimortis TaxID=1246637 RepID=A0A1W1H4H9_9BACT|nr:isoprenyl transferase [Desulfamplus magnetovallimortis]SLM27367.1 undecaprenyl pyrophosphate synthase [Desulfamplus magnetovallimortis]
MKSDPDKCLYYDIDPARIPRHVAIIMDGNGRWAKQRFKNRVTGHEKGSETVRAIVEISRQLGIQVLTLYAFSTENWGRPGSEVSALMSLLKKFIKSERLSLHEKGIRLGIIGQKHRLPRDVQNELDITMDYTSGNRDMLLNLALSYGGREEITRAVRSIARDVMEGKILWDDISEELISAHLYTANQPEPDMIIRTSGEMRLSNFLLWQAGYAEIFFTKTLWPDFTEQEFASMVKEYQDRDRRFGKVVCSSNDGSPQ